MRAVPAQDFASARHGSGAIEFALLAPVLLILVTGCVGLAQLIATQISVSTAEIGDFCQGARDELSPFPTAGLQLSIASVTRAARSVGFRPRRAGPARLPADRRGGVATLTAIAMLPLLLSTGIAIDLARVAQFRIALQGAADAASLAGAAVYTGTTNAGGATTGYTVAVAASAAVPTTFMSLVVPSVGTSVNAGALNPQITITASLGNWKSSAWDANTIYWYVVPPGGGLPAASALHMVFTNTAPAPKSLPPITITAGQSIGFALKNVTGGIHGYGSNQYGGTQGHANWIYSQLSPPSAQAYPTEPRNCALQVVVATTANPTPTETPGSCAAATPPNATLNCTQMPGKTVFYFWNDMGGGRDDYDYNDAQYSMTCPAAPSGSSVASATPTNVVLTQ